MFQKLFLGLAAIFYLFALCCKESIAMPIGKALERDDDDANEEENGNTMAYHNKAYDINIDTQL